MRISQQYIFPQKEDNDKEFLGMNVKKSKVCIFLCCG